VTTSGALDGILRTAIENSETVDLHISSVRNNEISIIAISTVNGRNYALDARGFMSIASLVYIMVPAIFLALLGIVFVAIFVAYFVKLFVHGALFSPSVILPLFLLGAGLLICLGAYKLFSVVRNARAFTKYNEALPNVILLK
jgi:hypothetical protein